MTNKSRRSDENTLQIRIGCYNYNPEFDFNLHFWGV